MLWELLSSIATVHRCNKKYYTLTIQFSIWDRTLYYGNFNRKNRDKRCNIALESFKKMKNENNEMYLDWVHDTYPLSLLVFLHSFGEPRGDAFQSLTGSLWEERAPHFSDDDARPVISSSGSLDKAANKQKGKWDCVFFKHCSGTLVWATFGLHPHPDWHSVWCDSDGKEDSSFCHLTPPLNYNTANFIKD